jgi:hypothetical protein
MEKAVRALEKVMADGRRSGDGGRRAAAAAGGAMEMEEDVGLWALGCCGERRGGAAECDHDTTDISVRVL